MILDYQNFVFVSSEFSKIDFDLVRCLEFLTKTMIVITKLRFRAKFKPLYPMKKEI